jgi:hypothetical protein
MMEERAKDFLRKWWDYPIFEGNINASMMKKEASRNIQQ